MKNSLVIVALCLTITVFSQTKKDSTQTKTDSIKKAVLLQEVIVTGNSKKDPSQVIVKSDYQDKVVQPKNTGELFQDINGFSLIKRGNYAVDPSFRASQYEQLNVQFDGGTKTYHACPNRMDPITTLVNPEEITRIEIIKGPFSVRYGATFGGTINMVTNNACGCEKPIMGTYSSGYESNGNSYVNMLQLMSKIKKFDISANMSQRDYGNYKDGNKNEIPSSFRSLGYGLKLGYSFTDNQRIQANFRQNFGRDVMHAGLPMDTEEDNSMIGSLDYKWTSLQEHFKGLTAKVYYGYVDHIMDNFKRSSFNSTETVATVEATTIGGKIETEFDFGKKVKLFSGIDMVNLARNGFRNRLVKRNMAGNLLPTPLAFEDKIWQDSYNNSSGVFGESKYYVNKNSMFTVGARLDFITSDAKDIDASFKAIYPTIEKRSETNFSGTISYKTMFSKNYVLEIAFGRGARSANIEERYIAFFNIGRDPYEYIGNPNLKAEVNNQFEIDFKGKKECKGFVNEIKYGTSVYYSIYENYIMAVVDPTKTRKFNPTTPPIHPKVFQNINNAFKTGFEFFADFKFLNHHSFLTEIAYVYTENKDFNESLPLNPPLVTRLKWSYEKGKFWTSVNYTLTAKQNKIASTYDEIATSGYQTMDFKVGYKPIEKVSIGLGVLNAFDQYYNNHLTFAFNTIEGFGRTPITEPGRNITLFASFTF
jgi:iron complex outermembrane receptor protein